MTLDASGQEAAPSPPTNELVAAAIERERTAGRLVDTTAPRTTMQEILEAMTAPERMLDTLTERGIDAADLVNELSLAEQLSDAALAALGPKVDGIGYVVDQFEAYAERTKARAAKLAAKAKAAENQAERIRARLLEQMEFYKFERLPGVEFKVERIRAAIPAMKVARPASAEDMLLCPEYVTAVPESYAWRTDVLKKALVAGATHSFATIAYSHRIDFTERDRPDVASKGKGKKK